MTDKELITLINLPEDFHNRFHNALEKQDTITALKYLAEYFKTRKSPSYFFNYNDVEQRVAEFKQSYPDQSNKIIESADEFIKTYGTDIDWLQPGIDLLGRKHTPNTVRYLARQEVAPAIALSYFLTKS